MSTVKFFTYFSSGRRLGSGVVEAGIALIAVLSALTPITAATFTTALLSTHLQHHTYIKFLLNSKKFTSLNISPGHGLSV